ncbi:ABC transporter substrate-binding protein [Breznakiella homolactica]|uniref:Extracellular solute-binding protein n=1 Tax=Breznakiella homolactica TaxID=2798577 RepID=A0A7T7XLD2_9SPIR|nr:extracellular solute-binding protein [Breznakiella homolactica]QQO08544.1 extracellular solute-binding protein [Breznakiella homolactica]
MKQRAKAVFLIGLLVICTAAVFGGGQKAPGNNAQTEPDKIIVSDWAIKNKMEVYTETPGELYELAKNEGKVVVYSLSSRAPRIKADFEKQYPDIVVEAYNIQAAELIEKITREYEAGIRNADIIHIQDLDGSVYKEMVLPGKFINYYPADICAHIDESMLTYSMPMLIELNYWYYNKEVYPEQPISSWWDLTKPEWKGKLVMQNPLDSFEYLVNFATLILYSDQIAAEYEKVFGKPIQLSPDCPTAGHELIKRLADNDIIFASSSDSVTEAVGVPGQKSAPLGYSASSKLRQNETNGYVLAAADMSPATSLSRQTNVYIVNEAPHPNAAKLMVRWLLGEADGKGPGFNPWNTEGGWPVRDDVPSANSTSLAENKFWAPDPEFYYYNIPDIRDFWISLQARRR